MLVYLADRMTRAYSSLASVLVAVILNRRAGLTWKVFMSAPMADFSSDASTVPKVLALLAT